MASYARVACLNTACRASRACLVDGSGFGYPPCGSYKMDVDDSPKQDLDMKIRFLDALNTLIQEKAKNCGILTPEKYNAYIEDVKSGKGKQKKESVHYRRLRKYDVMEIDGEERLIVPLTGKNRVITYYVHTEELFDILHSTHLKIGHRGRLSMLKELRTKYKNVTREIVTLYLRQCDICQVKFEKNC